MTRQARASAAPGDAGVAGEHGERGVLRDGQAGLPQRRDSALDGVPGRYFDRFDDARAHEQAYDAEAATRALVGD